MKSSFNFRSFIIILLCSLAIVGLSEIGNAQTVSVNYSEELLDSEQMSFRTPTQVNEINESLEMCRLYASSPMLHPSVFNVSLINERCFRGALLTSRDERGFEVPLSMNVFKAFGLSDSNVKMEHMIAFDDQTGLYVWSKTYTYTSGDFHRIVCFLYNSDNSFNRIIKIEGNKKSDRITTYYGEFTPYSYSKN